MLRWLVAAVVALSTFLVEPADAQVRVRGYTRRDGTYVAPHYRSNPDGNFWNNWSTKGNVNPYTGAPGTRVTPPTRYGAGLRAWSGESRSTWDLGNRSAISGWTRADNRVNTDPLGGIRGLPHAAPTEIPSVYRRWRTYERLGTQSATPLSSGRTGWIGRWAR